VTTAFSISEVCALLSKVHQSLLAACTGRGWDVALELVGTASAFLILPRQESRQDRLQHRILDLIGAGAGLLLATPVLLSAVVVIRLTMGSPILFRQVRPGRDARPFTLLKLRTMTEARDRQGRLLDDGRRLTRLGRLLRRLSVDELPQFWNVLRGDMSLVGPRPLRLDYLPHYTRRERKRHLVRPGITGLAQVSGRNFLPWNERLELDVQYVERRSLALDLLLLFRTFKKALEGSGVNVLPGAVLEDLSTFRRKASAEMKEEDSAGPEVAGSPLVEVPRLGEKLSISLWVKRDDLFPFASGGNKARKIVRILKEVEREGCNALVTAGALQSNHARVTALAAATKGWPCHLVLHGDRKQLARPTGNLELMRRSRATIEVVEPSEIGQALRSAMNSLRGQGYRPYLIPGGGHCLAGALAYVDAASELMKQCTEVGWHPDWILLASGTGTTQAGLIIGLERAGWKIRVVGISVARENPRGREIVHQSCRELRSHLRLAEPETLADFREDWIGDGYGKAGPSVLSAIRLAERTDGLILDPTYTGKALAALVDLVASGEIPDGAKVLFWHTGGIPSHFDLESSSGDERRP